MLPKQRGAGFMLKKILYLSMAYILIGGFSSILTGCGQTGALYLPDKTQISEK